MVDVVLISPNRDAAPLEASRNMRYTAHREGWVVPNTQTLLGDITELAAGPHNAFTQTSSGHTVTIDTGEAIAGGCILGRDVTTDVDLLGSTADQTVSVGWVPGSNNTVKIDLDSNFNAGEPKIPLWTFDTDGTGVTSATDERALGEQVAVQNSRYETSGTSGTKVDRAERADNATNADNADEVNNIRVTVSDTAPSSPDDGDIWIDSS